MEKLDPGLLKGLLNGSATDFQGLMPAVLKPQRLQRHARFAGEFFPMSTLL
jgi:hypothetical protein